MRESSRCLPRLVRQWPGWAAVTMTGATPLGQMKFEQVPTETIDLFLGATLRDLIYVWRGDLPVARAVETGVCACTGQ